MRGEGCAVSVGRPLTRGKGLQKPGSRVRVVGSAPAAARAAAAERRSATPRWEVGAASTRALGRACAERGGYSWVAQRGVKAGPTLPRRRAPAQVIPSTAVAFTCKCAAHLAAAGLRLVRLPRLLCCHGVQGNAWNATRRGRALLLLRARWQPCAALREAAARRQRGALQSTFFVVGVPGRERPRGGSCGRAAARCDGRLVRRSGAGARERCPTSAGHHYPLCSVFGAAAARVERSS